MSQSSDNNKRIAKNTLLLYFRMLITMLVGLFTSRVVLQTLGVSDYGLYNVVGGVVTMFTFINSTLACGTQRFLTFELGAKNKERLQRVFSTAMALHGLLALVLFLLVETIGLWFLYNKMNIEAGRMDAAFWVFQFSCITMIVDIIQVPYMSSIISHERMDIYAYMSIFDVAMKLLIVYLIQMVNYDKLILYGFLLLMVNCLSAFIYNTYCRVHFQECKIHSFFDKNVFKEMLNFSGWNVFGCASVTFQGQGVNILLNMFFGTVVNAARGIAFQVNGIVMQFVNNFQTAVNPQIVKHYAAGETKEMVKLATINSRLAAFLLLFIMVPLFVELEFVLKLWLGSYPDYTLAFLRIILFQSIVQTMTRPVVMMIHAVGKMKLVNLTAGSALLTILPVSYLLLKLGASPVTVFLVNVIPWFLETLFELLCLKKYIGLSPLAFYRDVYLRVFPIGILMFVLPILVCLLMNDGWLRFFSVCLVSVIWSSILIYMLGLDSQMRKFVRNKICLIFNKIIMVRKAVRYFKNMLKYVKMGGVVEVNISQVSPANMFQGKKVLITGGGSGFGYQMAKDFLAQGAEVMITGRNPQKLEKAKAELASDKLHTIVWDQADCSIVCSKLKEVVAELDGLDIAINNAGVWKNTNWHSLSVEEYDQIVDINTKGLYFLCRAEAEYYQSSKIRGKIINITSIEGNRPAFYPYPISKWGARCLTKGLAKEVARDGIQVNAIAPGVALTDINMALKNASKDNFYYPCHRTMRFTAVEEISNVAMFLASDQASNLIGQTIAVDGGWTIL